MEIEEDKYAMPEVTYEEYGDNMYKMEDLDYEVTEDVKEGELMTMSELDYVNMSKFCERGNHLFFSFLPWQ